MQSVRLNARSTSMLGFGGSTLGSNSPAASRRLLQIAFDAGIRHYDVAPMYGFGQSEMLLRDALGPKLSECTITTKFGLDPPPAPKWTGIRRLARATLNLVPPLKRRLQALASKDDPEPTSVLRAIDVQRSIDQSLKNLSVPQIDLFLLHEATPARLKDERLLDVLEKNREAGKILEYGIGSRSYRVQACVREQPLYCRFLQFEWSVFSPDSSGLESYPRIHHGSLGTEHIGLIRSLTESRICSNEWSQRIGMDLRSEGTIQQLLLKAALLHNEGSITLFSTRSGGRVGANVNTAENSRLDGPARIFHRLVKEQYPS